MSDHEGDERRVAAALKAVEGLPTEELEAGIVAEVIDSFRILTTIIATLVEADVKIPDLIIPETGERLKDVNLAAVTHHLYPLNVRLSKALNEYVPHDRSDAGKRRPLKEAKSQVASWSLLRMSLPLAVRSGRQRRRCRRGEPISRG